MPSGAEGVGGGAWHVSTNSTGKHTRRFYCPAFLSPFFFFFCGFQMDLNHVLDRDVGVLSGGELQRFAIGIVAVQQVRWSVHPRVRRLSSPCLSYNSRPLFGNTLSYCEGFFLVSCCVASARLPFRMCFPFVSRLLEYVVHVLLSLLCV